jgi:membrane associated rhomboid family serine protease
MNGISLFYLGQTRERNDGRARYVLLYFLAGLGGAVVQLLIADRDSGAVGASGAIFGLAGAELIFLWRHQRYMGASGRSAWIQLLSLLVIQLVIGFAAGSVIGNGAHMGGLAIGLAWAWIYGPNYVVPPQVPTKDADGIGVVRAKDTLPLSRGRVWGVLVLVGLILGGCLLLKLTA